MWVLQCLGTTSYIQGNDNALASTLAMQFFCNTAREVIEATFKVNVSINLVYPQPIKTYNND
jgi:hypothetical protein